MNQTIALNQREILITSLMHINLEENYSDMIITIQQRNKSTNDEKKASLLGAYNNDNTDNSSETKQITEMSVRSVDAISNDYV